MGRADAGKAAPGRANAGHFPQEIVEGLFADDMILYIENPKDHKKITRAKQWI